MFYTVAVVENLVILFIFVVTLAAIGLVHGAALYLYSYFPQRNRHMHSPNLSVQARLLLVLPLKSTMSSEMSASAKPHFHLIVGTLSHLVPVIHMQLKVPRPLH